MGYIWLYFFIELLRLFLFLANFMKNMMISRLIIYENIVLDLRTACSQLHTQFSIGSHKHLDKLDRYSVDLSSKMLAHQQMLA